MSGENPNTAVPNMIQCVKSATKWSTAVSRSKVLGDLTAMAVELFAGEVAAALRPDTVAREHLGAKQGIAGLMAGHDTGQKARRHDVPGSRGVDRCSPGHRRHLLD